MRYLFWNTNKKDVDQYLIEIISDYNPGIIALAEYEKNTNTLIDEINDVLKKEYIELPQLACRVKILLNTRLKDSVEHLNDHRYYTIKTIPYNSFFDSHIVVFLHLPSKMVDNEEKNRMLLEQICQQVNQIDERPDRKVLIFGDFNTNPYEKPMVSLTGCNAVSSISVAKKLSRGQKFDDRKFYYYYNPMWRFLGDNFQPNGTYYYNKTQMHSIYWNTFDQFVVSPKLAEDIKGIKIIHSVGKLNLCCELGLPKVSDHFPLFFQLGGN